MSDPAISAPLGRIIDALAKIAATEYLTSQAPPILADAVERPNPVPLRDLDEAA